MIYRMVCRSGVFWLLAVICLCSLVGCGGGRASVSGQVTFDGQPVEEGEIRFVPSSSGGGGGEQQMTGAAIVQGKYHVPADPGAVPGLYRVEIRAEKKTGKQVPAIPPAPLGAMTDITQPYIPAKYNDQSTLTLDISAGSNTKDFELTR